MPGGIGFNPFWNNCGTKRAARIKKIAECNGVIFTTHLFFLYVDNLFNLLNNKFMRKL